MRGFLLTGQSESAHNGGMTNTQITVLKVEDFEGTGECTMCSKTGLRWVVSLSDGSQVGGECAKKIMGWSPSKKSHGWVQGLTAVAERELKGGVLAVLWISEDERVGAVSISGNQNCSGPFEWAEKQFANLW